MNPRVPNNNNNTPDGRSRFAASLDAFRLHQPAAAHGHQPNLLPSFSPQSLGGSPTTSSFTGAQTSSGSSPFDAEFSVPTSTASSRSASIRQQPVAAGSSNNGCNSHHPASGLHGRRSSTLAQSHFQAEDVDSDEEAVDEDAEMGSTRSDSPEKYHQPISGRTLLPPPSMTTGRPSPSPGRRGLSPSPGSPRFGPMSLQDVPPQQQQQQSKSFNPLNPSNSRSQTLAQGARCPTPPPPLETTPMFTSSPQGQFTAATGAHQARPRAALARSKTSPSMRSGRRRAFSPSASSSNNSGSNNSRRASRDRAMTPEDMTSTHMTATTTAMDDSAVNQTAEEFQASFDALGMSLPGQGGEDDVLPSPISRGPVRRPVQRRGSLMPKSKQHLRVAQQLEDEGENNNAVDEVLSEAALHRLNNSRPSTLAFPSTSKAFMPNVTPVPGSNPSSWPPPLASTTANRFPESAAEDDAVLAGGSSPDTENDEIASVTQFEMEEDLAAGTSMSEAESESKKTKEAWFGFRERPAAAGASAAHTGSASVSSTPASMTTTGGGSAQQQQQQSSASLASTRPGKRKMGSDERFESFNSSAFKRRAVSPSASVSPGLASPTLSQGSGSFSTGPFHQNNNQNYNNPGSSASIAPSFSPKSYSRGGSPAIQSALGTQQQQQQAVKDKLYATGDAAALGLYLSQRFGSSSDTQSREAEEDSVKDMDI